MPENRRGIVAVVVLLPLILLPDLSGCATLRRASPRTTEVAASAPATSSPRLSAPGETSRDDAPVPFSALSRQVLEAHNRRREAAGLDPLELEEALTEAAEAHARAMAKAEELSHEGPTDGSTSAERVRSAGYRYQETGENIALGQDTVQEVMRDWMESPGHRKNILGATFAQMGFARARDAKGRLYWCVEFGTPWPRLDPSTAEADVIRVLNARRKELGKGPIEALGELGEIAREHGRELATASDPDEVDLDEVFRAVRDRGVRYRRATLSMGVGMGSARELVDHLMEKKDRDDHVLGNFDRVGVGVATRPDGAPVWLLVLIGDGDD